MATETSVMVALSELQKIEADRIESARGAERARAEEEARRTREEAAASRKQAELERVRIEAEARARVELAASRDRSLDELRARIASVQADREALRRDLRARIERAPEVPRRSPWALAFGLSSLVAAALAAMLVMHAQRAPEIVTRTVEVPIVAPAADRHDPIAAPRIAAAREPEPVLEAPSSVRPPRVRPHRPPPRRTITTPDLAEDLGLDEEDDDVLGGIHGARH